MATTATQGDHWLNAVTADGLTLEYVPSELKSVQLCTIAVEENEAAIEFVPRDLDQSNYLKLCLKALTSDGSLIRFMDQSNLELVLAALWDRDAVPHIENPSQDIYLLAVSADATALRYVPGSEQTLTMCVRAMMSNEYAMKYIKLREKGDLEVLLSTRGMFLGCLEPEYRTYPMCVIAINQHPWAGNFIPEKLDCSSEQRRLLFEASRRPGWEPVFVHHAALVEVTRLQNEKVLTAEEARKRREKILSGPTPSTRLYYQMCVDVHNVRREEH